MDDQKVTQAFARLDRALARAEAAASGLDKAPAADGGELAALRERHEALKHAVAAGLRQLDEVMAGLPR